MKPLKVLQIVPSISLVYGGPSQMIQGLSAALAQQPKDQISQVTILTTDSNGDVDEAPLDVPLGQPVMQDGYEVIHFRCSPFRRYKFSTGLLSWLWANAHHYDIAHAETVDGEFTTLEDVTEATLFCAAFPSNAMTGQSFVVSHGWYMQ